LSAGGSTSKIAFPQLQLVAIAVGATGHIDALVRMGRPSDQNSLIVIIPSGKFLHIHITRLLHEINDIASTISTICPRLRRRGLPISCDL
jgi:hypothetical protein